MALMISPYDLSQLPAVECVRACNEAIRNLNYPRTRHRTKLQDLLVDEYEAVLAEACFQARRQGWTIRSLALETKTQAMKIVNATRRAEDAHRAARRSAV